MPLDYSHPKTIIFLKENYEKENDQRISWFVKNKDEIIKAATLTDKHKGYRTEHVARAFIEPMLPVLSLHHKVTKVNRLTKVPLDNPMPFSHNKNKHHNNKLITDIDLMPAPLMKPVNPNVSKILYDEVPTGGRREYLKVRNKLAPEERYNSCETSNNVCGWRLSDSERVRQPSEYKRYAYLKRDTTNRSGPQPDPKHYRHLREYSKCDA